MKSNGYGKSTYLQLSEVAFFKAEDALIPSPVRPVENKAVVIAPLTISKGELLRFLKDSLLGFKGRLVLPHGFLSLPIAMTSEHFSPD